MFFVALYLGASGLAFGEIVNLRKHNTNPKTKYDLLYKIDLVDGVPRNRSFEKLEPIFVKAATMDQAVYEARRLAQAAGADAIIEVESGNMNNGTKIGTLISTIESSSSEFYVKGWAVRYTSQQP